MKTKSYSMFAVLVFVVSICFGQTKDDPASLKQLQTISGLVEAKKYAEAITAYERFLQQAPKSLQGPVQFEIAALHAILGNSDRSLAMMEQAIQSGFDDCLAVQQYEEFKPFQSNPRFQELCSRIRISEADRTELFWLKTEMQNVSHETKMMITENINRVDSGMTVITQSIVPLRETASPGVLFNREFLKLAQQLQRQYVLQADTMRIRHLTSMTIISGGASSQRVALSSLYAQRTAEGRRRAVEARKFSLPPGAETTPQACGEWK